MKALWIKFWSWVTQWIMSVGGWAHAIALGFATAVGAYYGVPQFRAVCDGIYNDTPTWVHTAVLTGVALVAWYKKTSSMQGAANRALQLQDPPPSSFLGKSALILVAVGVLSLGLGGCTNFERDAFNTLATSKSVIDSAQDAYTARTIPQTACTYAVINDAKAAQTVAVNSMIVYEQEKAAGKDLSAQTAAITVDLEEIVPLVAEIKMLYSNPSACVAPKIGATS